MEAELGGKRCTSVPKGLMGTPLSATRIHRVAQIVPRDDYQQTICETGRDASTWANDMVKCFKSRGLGKKGGFEKEVWKEDVGKLFVVGAPWRDCSRHRVLRSRAIHVCFPAPTVPALPQPGNHPVPRRCLVEQRSGCGKRIFAGDAPMEQGRCVLAALLTGFPPMALFARVWVE